MAWDDIPEWAYSVTQTLLESLRARDPYTYGHCRRVARLAAQLAESAGLNEYEQRVVEFSSIFHDLGKLGIPDSILLKPGRLTPEENTIIKEHPTRGVEILRPLAHIPFFRSLLPGIRHHHERIDGKGYPDGIMGDHIPLTARVILVADTFDAMTTNRPYRKAHSHDFAYRELKNFSGRQFDAKLVQIFLDAHPHWLDVEKEVAEDFSPARIAPIRRKAA